MALKEMKKLRTSLVDLKTETTSKEIAQAHTEFMQDPSLKNRYEKLQNEYTEALIKI